MLERRITDRDEFVPVTVEHLDSVNQLVARGWAADHDELNQLGMTLNGVAEKSKLGRIVEVGCIVQTLRHFHERNNIIILKPEVDG